MDIVNLKTVIKSSKCTQLVSSDENVHVVDYLMFFLFSVPGKTSNLAPLDF